MPRPRETSSPVAPSSLVSCRRYGGELSVQEAQMDMKDLHKRHDIKMFRTFFVMMCNVGLLSALLLYSKE